MHLRTVSQFHAILPSADATTRVLFTRIRSCSITFQSPRTAFSIYSKLGAASPPPLPPFLLFPRLYALSIFSRSLMASAAIAATHARPYKGAFLTKAELLDARVFTRFSRPLGGYLVYTSTSTHRAKEQLRGVVPPPPNKLREKRNKGGDNGRE